jgi:hypothetical protein
LSATAVGDGFESHRDCDFLERKLLIVGDSVMGSSSAQYKHPWRRSSSLVANGVKTCLPGRTNRTTAVPFSKRLYRRRHTQAHKILLRVDEILAELAKGGQPAPSGESLDQKQRNNLQLQNLSFLIRLRGLCKVRRLQRQTTKTEPNLKPQIPQILQIRGEGKTAFANCGLRLLFGFWA